LKRDRQIDPEIFHDTDPLGTGLKMLARYFTIFMVILLPHLVICLSGDACFIRFIDFQMKTNGPQTS